MSKKKDELTFEAQDKTVEEILFSRFRYRIPRYQRPYTWGEDEINDFWTDLCVSSSSYFIGSFVFNYESHKEDRYIDVIDGQQRLITITIFMAALRDLAKELGDLDCAKRIQTHCISFEDRRGKHTNRVLCGDSTRPFFEKNVQDFESNILEAKPTTKEERLIRSNYTKLRELIQEEIKKDNASSNIEKLQSLWDKISDIKVIWIKIESEEDAYEIFETVNARGVDLTVADLLKNLVFKELKSSKEENTDLAKEKWKEIESNIEQTGVELNKFLRHYWLSKHGFVTEKKLFKNIKAEIKDYKEFLEDLCDASKWYNQMLQGDTEDWADVENGEKLLESLRGIRVMKVTQCYVLFLSILRNLEKLGTNPKRIFDLVEKFSFNYSLIANQPGNRVEKIYSKYAVKIEGSVDKNSQKNTSKRIQALFSSLEKELKELKPFFEGFKRDFMRVSYKNSEKARVQIKYILSKINDHLGTGESRIDFNNVNIEHLLPQKPNKEWGVSKDTIKEYVNKLGNLTLVHKGINSKIGNKSLSEKLSSLQESSLPITQNLVKEVSALYDWGEQKIMERQANLASIAYHKVWDF